MRIMTALLFILMLTLSGVAHADPAISEAGAVSLKKQVENDLQWRVDMAKTFSQGLVIGGKVEVTPKDSFYEVKLPKVSMLSGPSGKLDVGTVIINTVPGLQPGTWLITAALPSSMTYYSTSNAPMAYITLGAQHFSATWWPDKSMYPKIDLSFQDMQIKGTNESAVKAEIKSIDAHVDLKANEDSTWSGPVDFSASGININITGKPAAAITIGDISSHTTYDRLNMRLALQAKTEAQEYLKSGAPQTDKDRRELIAKLLSKSSLTADGIDSRFGADKFLLHIESPAPQQPAREIAIDQLVLSSTATAAQQEKGKLSLKMALNGLHISFVPDSLTDIVPQTLNTEADLDSLPIKKLSDLLLTALQKSTATAADAATQAQTKADMAAALSALPKMLQEAGTSISIKNTFMKSAAVDTTIAGKIDASTSSPLGAAGKITLAFKGLDEFIHKLQSSALQPGADPHALGFIMGLTALQMKGHPDKAADGKSLLNYIFELTQDGKILLNGTDLKPPPAPIEKPSAVKP